ncbi:uncharacterized protein LOC130998182 [Salvia miltiorrhiza]|uniref:uncharacterized protein LOC130998182 n=1 Tax=Salvia miltiorrhiza TaxID=226208 RepID=UPI0025AD25C6|nr:uncharacterized protein LOC130998182 [Salvia miltiorrhiza]
MSENREWMYRRFLPDGALNPDFQRGLQGFIDYASSRRDLMDGEKIRCPCRKCDNIRFHTKNNVQYHIAKNGFVRDYHIWRFHGEIEMPTTEYHNFEDIEDNEDNYQNMVMDIAASQYNIQNIEEPPNPKAELLYNMLKAADKELWPGCKTHSQLSLVARVMSLKAEGNMSERCFDQWLDLIKEILPENNLAPTSFYETKKLLSGMGLPVQRIDCCPNNCMLYWEDDRDLVQCKYCGESRYKNNRDSRSSRKTLVAAKRMFYFPLTPRLQRLFASKATAADMRWHASSIDDGVMRHPADSPTWKHLNDIFPDFATEVRNVRLGLSTDGFQPFGQSGQQYSSWPVIVTPYNLPPWMCMKEQFMFLTILVPGPRNPKEKLDVFLQPLIAELIQLWNVGVLTYDVSLKQNFQMRAALLWTISDFPAYSMLSGWSTAGRLACPHCMDETEAFTLSHSGKQSWFDNHRKFLPINHPFRKDKKSFTKNKVVTAQPPQGKSGQEILAEIELMGFVKVTGENQEAINKASARRYGTGWKKRSIFWDLPYWKFLLIRHNLDVMHVEKNVFDNVFNTVLNVPGRTKDTSKSREELNTYCSRPALKRNQETNKYPKACYTLDTNEKRVLCEWVKTLRFPDGYVSNMGRCVDLSKLKMFGMKSHDCHVFMQRILPIAFRELLPVHVWNAITELSLFFKDLCSRNIQNEDMCRLNDMIPITLCKLERIFPPSFFDSMEHLPVHLADEARLAGPVQFRWMYPFERYLRKLKNNVRNKARVEGSICNAYIVEEALF